MVVVESSKIKVLKISGVNILPYKCPFGTVRIIPFSVLDGKNSTKFCQIVKFCIKKVIICKIFWEEFIVGAGKNH